MAHEGGRTLRSEDEISHYRIVGPLGAGGMGEVYLAQDRTLERSVALKILPPELVRSEDRVRRFILEAKSASSLSHPNIVTIYEIGQDELRSPGAEPSSALHFISMELVNGKTLSNLIHEERTDLRTLLGWLAQAADGLAKAHAAGIVHRDLKPGNIMVTNDGFAKVLDFGLAKLTEQRAGGASDGGTTGGPQMTQQGATGIGVIVGTAGYMAPEQVAGKSIDHRADIFSFGCILYEAATRRAPFAAETSIETMHRILNEKPAPIEEVNPAAPAELRRLIRRCLAKNPEQRLQSMKDLALELREIVDDYDALSASASSASLPAGAALAPQRRTPSPRILAIGAAVLLVLAAGAWWAVSRGNRTMAEPAFAKMRMTTQTSRGDVRNCALSPDGRYLAYTAGIAGAITLHVVQVATGSDVEVIPPSRDPIDTPAFTPDGNYLFFRMRRRDAQSYSALYQMPSLGGAPQERAFDVDSRVSFSPDGKRLVFWRNVTTENENRLVEYDLDASKERVVTAVKYGEFPVGAPAWSPDGKQIVVALFSPEKDLSTTIALVDPASGKRRDHQRMDWTQVRDFAWLPDGSGFAMTAALIKSTIVPQVLLVGYPGKEVQRVTNDFLSYFSMDASGGAEAIAAVRATRLSNLWVIDADGGAPRAITRVTNPESSPQSIAAPDSATLLYDAPRDQGIPLWSIPIAGGEPRVLSPGTSLSINLVAAAGRVAFDRLDAGGVHVWSMNADGSDPRQVTTGSGEQHGPISADGRLLAFARYSEPRTGRILSLADGKELPARTGDTAGPFGFSRDGRTVLVGRHLADARGLLRPVLRAQPVDGSAATDSVALPGDGAGPQWSPDERGILYLATSDPAANVMRIGFGAAVPTQVTRLTRGRISDYLPSPDGTRLALIVRDGAAENVWITAADGSSPRQVTQFTGGEVFDMIWVDAHRTLAIGAGTITNDVVLIRDFR